MDTREPATKETKSEQKAVRYTKADAAVFARAMAVDGLDDMSAFFLRAARLHANRLLGLSSHPIQNDISKLSDQISESHSKLLSEIQKLAGPFEE